MSVKNITFKSSYNWFKYCLSSAAPAADYQLSGNDSKWFLKKSFFKMLYGTRGPPTLHGKCHFPFFNPSLMMVIVIVMIQNQNQNKRMSHLQTSLTSSPTNLCVGTESSKSFKQPTNPVYVCICIFIHK